MEQKVQYTSSTSIQHGPDQSFIEQVEGFKSKYQKLQLTENNLEEAVDFRKDIVDFIKEVEQMRKDKVGPYNNFVKKVNLLHKGLITDAEKVLKPLEADYTKIQTAIQKRKDAEEERD